MQLSPSIRNELRALIIGKIGTGCSVSILDARNSTITTLSASSVSFSDTGLAYTVGINDGVVIAEAAEVASFVVSKGSEQIFIGSVTQVGYGGDLEFETVSWVVGAYVYIGNIIIKEIV